MNHKQSSSESGQVLVILVLVMVGLLAFTALAIDGGILLADRRGAQNAGDAAVLAGGFRIANSLDDYVLDIQMDYESWDCDHPDMATATDYGVIDAVNKADDNGYPIGTSGNITGSITVQCEQGLDMGSYEDKYVDTTAQISSQVDTAFAHFAFDGPLLNSIIAISRVRPRMPLAFGYAIYAFGDGCGPGSDPGGINFDGGGGGGSVIVNGGGMFSNTCITGNGGVDVIVNDGFGIGYLGDNECNGSNCSVSPAPTQQTEPLPDWALLFPEPDCSGLSSQPDPPNGTATISRGIYDGFTVNGSDNLTLEPGLYCFTGNLNATGGTITGEGVTIYMQSGGINIGGGMDDVDLSAPGFVGEEEDGKAGMLIYMAEDNEGVISLTGNSNTTFTGVIFAANPDSEIDISGTADAVFNCQLIAGMVTVGGAAQITVNFDYGLVHKLPARLTLEK